MIRETSRTAYQQIKAEGLLSRMRWRVYDAIYHHGPLTGHELDTHLAHPDETKTSYHKRLSELLRLRVVRIAGERPCKITGRVAVLWDVTTSLPVVPATRRLSRAARLRAVIVAEIERHRQAGRDKTATHLRQALRAAEKETT